MKKIFYIILFTHISLLQFCSSQEKNQNNKITFATSAEYPPFEYKIKGKLVGFDIELAKIIAKKLGKKAKFKDMQFSSVMASVKSGIADLAISTITITKERAKNFDFSLPYYQESMSIIFPKTKPIKNKSELEGKKIACMLGTTMEIWLKKNIKDIKIISTDNNTQAIEILKSNNANGVLIDSIQASHFVKKNPQLNYKFIAKSNNGYAIAFNKGSKLREKVNQILTTLKKEGSLDKLKEKWIKVNQNL